MQIPIWNANFPFQDRTQAYKLFSTICYLVLEARRASAAAPENDPAIEETKSVLIDVRDFMQKELAQLSPPSQEHLELIARLQQLIDQY